MRVLCPCDRCQVKRRQALGLKDPLAKAGGVGGASPSREGAGEAGGEGENKEEAKDESVGGGGESKEERKEDGEEKQGEGGESKDGEKNTFTGSSTEGGKAFGVVEPDDLRETTLLGFGR